MAAVGLDCGSQQVVIRGAAAGQQQLLQQLGLLRPADRQVAATGK
jgi:hypothetical protein